MERLVRLLGSVDREGVGISENMEIIRGKTKNIPIPMSYADWRLSLSQINKSDATDTGPAASKVSATCFPNWICSSLAALVSLLLPYFAPQLCILAQKSMDDTVDLTGDGGVLKTIIRKPRHDELAPSDSIPVVDVHYEGTLAETGEVFDTTHEDNSVFSFEVGSGTVIKAWDIALRTMKVGEICKITCKPDYAYGSVGSPPEIPPNATLVFEVELVACRPRKGASLGSVSDEKARLQELKKQRESIAASKEEEKKKREEAKAAAAARIQAKLESKKSQGKGKGKAK